MATYHQRSKEAIRCSEHTATSRGNAHGPRSNAEENIGGDDLGRAGNPQISPPQQWVNIIRKKVKFAETNLEIEDKGKKVEGEMQMEHDTLANVRGENDVLVVTALEGDMTIELMETGDADVVGIEEEDQFDEDDLLAENLEGGGSDEGELLTGGTFRLLEDPLALVTAKT